MMTKIGIQDRNLIENLQRNAGLTNADVACQLEVSEPSLRRRIDSF